MEEIGDGLQVESCALGRTWLELRGPGLLQVTRGEIVVAVGEDRVRAVALDLVSLAPDAGCRIRAARSTATAERVWLSAEFVERGLALARAAGIPIGSGAGRVVVERRSTDRARRAARLLRDAAAGQGGASPSQRLAQAARGMALLALVVDAGSGEESHRAGVARRNPSCERFLRAVGELHHASCEEITLPRFASRAGLSRRHASRLFQVELGRSFREYLCDLRLERAKQLLLGTEMSVIEVAAEAGWSSLPHFNAVFRRRVGTTPTRYRRGAPVPRRAPTHAALEDRRAVH